MHISVSLGHRYAVLVHCGLLVLGQILGRIEDVEDGDRELLIKVSFIGLVLADKYKPQSVKRRGHNTAIPLRKGNQWQVFW